MTGLLPIIPAQALIIIGFAAACRSRVSRSRANRSRASCSRACRSRACRSRAAIIFSRLVQEKHVLR